MIEDSDHILTDNPDYILTEKEVQKIALSALRSYYRFRVKAGIPELISDVRGAGGIIADVQYSFPQEDGSRFMATLEATAAASRDEVYFRRREGLLLVDSLATGSFATGLIFLLTHIFKVGLVIQNTIFEVVCMIISTTLLLSAAFYLLMRKKRRYRYIYAVEQFKQYYADEQWIAFGEDVFPDHQSPYYQELREQCTQYGFGLIQINKDRKPHLIITPARQDVFGNRRRNIAFYTIQQLERLQRGGAIFREQVKKITAGLPLPASLQQLQQLQLPKFTKGLKKLPPALNPSDPAYLFRFKRSYLNQMVIMGFSVAMMIAVFIRELPQRPNRYVSQRQYAEEVIAAEESHGPEPDFVIDLYDTIYLEPYDTTVIPYLALVQSERMIADGFIPSIGNEVLISMFDGALILYDCERLYNFQTSKYMVQEGIYPDFESASQRMSQLLMQKLEVNCLWMGCFDKNQNQYVLYFGLLQNTLPEAQTLAQQYQKKLTELQMSAKITIRMLSKPKR